MKFNTSGLLIAAAFLTSCATGSINSPADMDDAQRAEIVSVLAQLDDRTLSTDEQLENYLPDAVILPPGEAEIRGTDALRVHLDEFGSDADLTTQHEIVELDFIGTTALVQGRVVGTASPHGDPNTYDFETKNLIVLQPDEDGALKISRVIYNGAPSADATEDPAAANPEPRPNSFSRFTGTWTLKDDEFQQVWDGETVETLTIPNHFTTCDRINTDKSSLCVVDAGDFEGHIVWAHDEAQGQFRHLSHFGESRLGTGVGTINETGDLNIRITFSDEPEGTYRIYDYVWITDDAYEMMSRQYAKDGTATGNWYGGTFVRVDGAR